MFLNNFKNTTTSNSVYKSTAPDPVDTYDPLNNVLEDIGTNSAASSRFPRYNNSNTLNSIDSTTFTQNYTNVSSPSSSGTYSAANLYSYGNYYSWAAAMANVRSFYSSGYSDEANTSICPKNWHLPSGNPLSSGMHDFLELSQGYGGSGGDQSGSSGAMVSGNIRSFPNNFLYSGQILDTFSSSRGSYGNYWSKTSRASDYNTTYHLRLGNTSIDPSSQADRYAGFSVRCMIAGS